MNKNIFIKIFIALFLCLNIFNFLPKNTAQANNNIYHVPVELWHSENSGRLSMGNNALGSLAQVEETATGSIITVEFIPMHFMNMNGHLLSMSVYSGSLFSGSLNPAQVISTYSDKDLNGKQATFPALLQFQRSAKKEDKIGIKVSVDAMNQVLGGDASQNAILKFNWAGAKLVSSGSSTPAKQTPAQTTVAAKKENTSNTKPTTNNIITANSNQTQKASNNSSLVTTTTTTTENSKTSNKESNSEEEKKPKLKSMEDFFKSDSKTLNPGLYNIDITAAYLNPLTGVTADGGTKNVEIGEGMSQGVISPVNADTTDLSSALKNQKAGGEKRWSKAQLQRTKDGKLYATVRIHLINWVKRSADHGPFIKVLHDNGEYKLVKSTESKVHIEEFKDSYADYTFEVPKENFSAMIQMFVEPMNRPVRFFVEVNPETITPGGVPGMEALDGANKGSLNNTKNSKNQTNNSLLYLAFVIIPIIGVIALAIIKKRKNSNQLNQEIDEEDEE